MASASGVVTLTSRWRRGVDGRRGAPIMLNVGRQFGHGRDPAIEMQFSMADQWSRRLLLALARRYGWSPYRYRRQRLTTVMIRVPRGFVDQVLWPEFQALNNVLMQYLNDVTLRVIREEVHGDTSEAAEVAQALPSGVTA